jgi:hypothetical protein
MSVLRLYLFWNLKIYGKVKSSTWKKSYSEVLDVNYETSILLLLFFITYNIYYFMCMLDKISDLVTTIRPYVNCSIGIACHQITFFIMSKALYLPCTWCNIYYIFCHYTYHAHDVIYIILSAIIYYEVWAICLEINQWYFLSVRWSGQKFVSPPSRYATFRLNLKEWKAK